MEVKPGYKQTEVGLIPRDWQVAPLSELITEFRGGAPLKPSDFTRSGIKVLPKGAVSRTGWLHIDEDDVQFCSPSYAASHSGNQVNETCTIVVLRDLVPSGPSIGLIVQIKEPATFVLAQGVYGFKTNQRALPGYLVQLSNTRWYRQLMNSIMVGSTQVHITNTAFKLAKVPLPPPSEQRAIAEALSDVDGLLSGLDQLIAKKRDLKQAAMQQLLTAQTRLLGFHGKWELKGLGHAGRCLRGVSYQGERDLSPYDTNRTKRLLRANNVQDAVLVTTDVQFVNAARVSPQQVLRKNDILICMASGSKELVGKAGLFAVNDGYDYTFGAFMGCFRTDPEVANSNFIFFLTQTNKYRDYINNVLAGSSINNLRAHPRSFDS
jgi:type I restriction enzyme, S subunit